MANYNGILNITKVYSDDRVFPTLSFLECLQFATAQILDGYIDQEEAKMSALALNETGNVRFSAYGYEISGADITAALELNKAMNWKLIEE